MQGKPPLIFVVSNLVAGDRERGTLIRSEWACLSHFSPPRGDGLMGLKIA